MQVSHNLRATSGRGIATRAVLGTSVLASLVWATLFSHSARAADPYITAPPSFKACGKPAVKIPEHPLSSFYPSDECGTIFIGPPGKITTAVATQLTGISQSECDANASLRKSLAFVNEKLAQYAKDVVEGKLTSQQAAERKAQIDLGFQAVKAGLADDYKVFGGNTGYSLQLDWIGEVKKWQEVNTDYNVLPLPTAAGLVSFQERIPPAEMEAYGLYNNPMQEPLLSYTLGGINPITTTSPILDENKLPIFFPVARAERSGFKQIEYGGGNITASLTFNKAGFCIYKSDAGQNPIAILTPAINFGLALKTFGTYTVKINTSYLMQVADSISKSTSGTYYASAVADDFYRQQGSSTISVDVDDDLRNSLSSEQREGLVQTVLYDQANQFLTTLTGEAGKKKAIRLPDVQNVSQYATVQRMARVCNRSSGFFGIGASSSCYDQAYNVQVLQDTTQLQAAKAIVTGAFNGIQQTRKASYVLVPANAGL